MAKYENKTSGRESREAYEGRRIAVQRQHYEEQQRSEAWNRARAQEEQLRQSNPSMQNGMQNPQYRQNNPAQQNGGQNPQYRQNGGGGQPGTPVNPQYRKNANPQGNGANQQYRQNNPAQHNGMNGMQNPQYRQNSGQPGAPVPPQYRQNGGQGTGMPPRGPHGPAIRYPGEPEPEKNQPKKKGGIGGVLTTIVLIAAIAVFCFAAYKLVGYYLEYKAGSDEYARLEQDFVTISPVDAPEDGSGNTQQTDEGQGSALKDVEELEDPSTKQAKVVEAAKDMAYENGEQKQLPTLVNPINFDELNSINEEIIGWIRLGALDISYPIAQAADNDYYLHRTFEKKDNFAGCIFLNCDNSRYFTDQNSIIYGHNMKNGSMFGRLKDLKEQATYDSNPYFWIFTPELIYQYRIFSCSVVGAVGDPYRIRFTTDEFQTFIKTMYEGSMIDSHGVETTADDRVVTLSTCTGNDATRFIVQGRLEQVYISK